MREYGYVLGTVFLTVYGQIIVKWRVGQYGKLPETIGGKVIFFIRFFSDPYILSVIVAIAAAAMLWIAAVIRLDLGKAYPIIAMTFVLVPIASAFFFGERITPQAIAGALLITLGVFISTWFGHW